MYEKDVNIMDIEKEDLPTEQKVFKAAMQKYTTVPKPTSLKIISITNFDNIPKYNISYVEFLSTKFETKKKGKSKYILNWCEEPILASERWPELVTESKTDVWNLPDPYTWKTFTNEPELLPTTVPVPLSANPVPWWLLSLETPSETYMLEHSNYSEYYLVVLLGRKL
ncbi:25646_t:CDS:2 [Gigaspora margarita]|uniref:25646_t:CDS:1 n=1 Tax=Gigaspora margarita TaxID=4874 RepID=A0ABN7VG58_GIGMA|nr:25646_t:CDS:2 [Gigaspora margarita]